nr:helix-turn-helix domain-containing protein [Halopolyspora algeriensis]
MRTIAARLDRYPSTVPRELRRNKSGLAWDRCSCKKRAGSILGCAIIAWDSSLMSGNPLLRITR